MFATIFAHMQGSSDYVGWRRDPTRRFDVRYRNADGWTDHVALTAHEPFGGQTYNDPYLQARASGGPEVQPERIEVHTADLVDRVIRVCGLVRARVASATVFSNARTMEDVNSGLREKAAALNANAVVQVRYVRGISATSWKTLTASGIAVVIDSDERECPYCAEHVKAKAKLCRYCGHDLPQLDEPEIP
jgi:hypothetical protein